MLTLTLFCTQHMFVMCCGLASWLWHARNRSQLSLRAWKGASSPCLCQAEMWSGTQRGGKEKTQRLTRIMEKVLFPLGWITLPGPSSWNKPLVTQQNVIIHQSGALQLNMSSHSTCDTQWWVRLSSAHRFNVRACLNSSSYQYDAAQWRSEWGWLAQRSLPRLFSLSALAEPLRATKWGERAFMQMTRRMNRKWLSVPLVSGHTNKSVVLLWGCFWDGWDGLTKQGGACVAGNCEWKEWLFRRGANWEWFWRKSGYTI